MQIQQIPKEKHDALCNALKNNDPNLTSIFLANNAIDDIKTILEALKCNTTVKTLIYDNEHHCSSEVLQYIAELLKVNRSLQMLDLDYVTGENIKSICEALNENSSLLNIQLNNYFCSQDAPVNRLTIGDDGAKAIAELLKVNSSLQEFNISYNNIGNEGAIALAEAIERNSSLKTVDLRGNTMGEAGFKAIAYGLAWTKNASLENLLVFNQLFKNDNNDNNDDIVIAFFVAKAFSLSKPNFTINESEKSPRELQEKIDQHLQRSPKKNEIIAQLTGRRKLLSLIELAAESTVLFFKKNKIPTKAISLLPKEILEKFPQLADIKKEAEKKSSTNDRCLLS
ncbi:MAG: hypothetical protein WBE18_08850 [Gammaproteobacteria bacterium]